MTLKPLEIRTFTGENARHYLRPVLNKTGVRVSLRLDWKKLLEDSATCLKALTRFENLQTPTYTWTHDHITEGLKRLHQGMVDLARSCRMAWKKRI